jgi:hypothetical protein
MLQLASVRLQIILWLRNTSLFTNNNSNIERSLAPDTIARCFISTPTRGADAFGMELPQSHRFGSSGLSLTFKGLLLGASLHLRLKVTSSDPRKLVPWPTMFLCVQDLFAGGRRLWGLAIEGSGKRTSVGRPAEVEAKGYELQVSPLSKIGGRHATPDTCWRFIWYTM